MYILNYPLKIVLVDDDPEMLKLMEFYLKDYNDFEIFSFTSPIEAFSFLSKEDVAIAIVDINMDEMYGDEVLRKINEGCQGTEVIIITAGNNLINFTACYNAKASGYIFKPFTPDRFHRTIELSHDRIKEWAKVFQKMIERKHKESA